MSRTRKSGQHSAGDRRGKPKQSTSWPRGARTGRRFAAKGPKMQIVGRWYPVQTNNTPNSKRIEFKTNRIQNEPNSKHAELKALLGTLSNSKTSSRSKTLGRLSSREKMQSSTFTMTRSEFARCAFPGNVMDFVVDVLRFELKMQSIIPLWSLTRKFQGFLLRTIRQVFSDFRILALRNFRLPAGLSRAHPVGPAALMMSWNVFFSAVLCVFL